MLQILALTAALVPSTARAEAPPENEESRSSTITVSLDFGPFLLHEFEPPDVFLIAEDGRTLDPPEIVRRTTLLFRNVPEGSHAVVMSDPRLLPVRLEPVRPGDFIALELRGSASLRLILEGEAEKVGLEDITISLRAIGRDFLSANLAPHWDGPLVRDGLIAGLFPGDYQLVLEADGFEPLPIRANALLPGEERSVRCGLGRPTTADAWVFGKVTLIDAGRHDEKVHLLRPARTDDSPTSQIKDPRYHHDVPQTAREIVRSASLGPDGSYEIRVPANEDFLVLSYIPGGLSVESPRFRLKEGERRELDLVMKPGASVVGRLLTSAGCTPEGVRVAIWPEDRSDSGRFWSIEPCVVDAEGNFTLEDLPPGTAKLILLLPRVESRMQQIYPAPHIVLGSEEIAAGEQLVREYVVSELPGRVELTLDLADAPTKNVQIWLRDPKERVRTNPVAFHGNPISIAAFPGDHELLVRLDRWHYLSPELVRIEGCMTREQYVRPLLFPGMVHISWPDGESIGKKEVQVFLKGRDIPLTRAHSSVSGVVELRLSPGSYRVRVGHDFGEIEWTEDGPRSPLVRLQAK